MSERQSENRKSWKNRPLPELLAPAGNLTCLKAAVDCGADAVYVGAKAFSARAGANNFSSEELSEAADYCHLRGAKLHLALNTMLFDREFAAVLPLIEQACEIGVDAVIIQDLGLARLIRQVAPDLPLHASTQMSIHSLGGALAAKELGFSRVVLAREMSREEIRRVSEEAGIETEIFIHGALCVCYSGQCLMSSFLGGRSGNRGRCAQPCRLKYSAGQWKEKTLLSPKDSCLLPHLPEICNLGVDSLKIEGRMKGPDYVSVVVSIYRKYLDSGEVPTEEDLGFLQNAFDRGGYTDGYFTGQTGRAMFCFDKPERPYGNQSRLDATPKKKISAEVSYSITAGQPAVLAAKSGDGVQVCVRTDFTVEKAQKTPTSEERIRQQLLKTGDTVYQVDSLTGEYGGDVFVAIGALNALRRELFDNLDRARLERNRRIHFQVPAGDLIEELVSGVECKKAGEADSKQGQCFTEYADHAGDKPAFTIEVQTLEQWEAVQSFPAARFYLPAHLAGKIVPGTQKDKIWYVLPRILKDEQVKTYQKLLERTGVTRIAVGNLGQLVDFRGYELHGALGLNAANSSCLYMLKKFGVKSVMLSPEMSMAHANALQSSAVLEYLGYGKLPLMITENCLAESIWKTETCTYQSVVPELTDRKGETFRLMRHGNTCRTELLNCVPLYLADKQEEIGRLHVSYMLLRFTDETPEDCQNILNLYQGLPGKKPMRITRGYFLKNLE